MCRFMSFINFEIFQPLFLHIISLFLPLLSWDSHYAYVVTFDGVPKVPWGVFNFLHSFSFLLLRQNNFNCLNYEFTDCFFCWLKSASESL